MKFEITYNTGAKIEVEIPDPEFRAYLDNQAKRDAAQLAAKLDADRGIPTSVKVV